MCSCGLCCEVDRRKRPFGHRKKPTWLHHGAASLGGGGGTQLTPATPRVGGFAGDGSAILDLPGHPRGAAGPQHPTMQSPEYWLDTVFFLLPPPPTPHLWARRREDTRGAGAVSGDGLVLDLPGRQVHTAVSGFY